MSIGLSRRLAIGGLAAAPLARPAAAAESGRWIAYDQRLRARLADAADGYFDEAMGRALQTETNRFRFEEGLDPLAWDEDLAAAARAHGADMVDRAYFGHPTPDGFDVGDRVGCIARTFLGVAGENLAHRFDPQETHSALEFMALWRDSPGHRSNLLRASFTHVGYGVVRHGLHARAVGVYARIEGRLGEAMPWRISGRGEIERLLAAATPRIGRYALSDPGDLATGVVRLGSAQEPLPRGASQLRPVRQAGRDFRLLWGPIFVV